ncbi:putative transcription factor interactor and regulator CCHC(Zn) family protein [Tanacetum coccineum]
MVEGDNPSGSGGVISNTTETSKLIYRDELYLHPNDSSITNFISIKLKGTENYNIWNCAMTLALQTKKKIGFINGGCKKPTEKSLANQWDLCNYVVLSWILGSISQDLYLGQCFSTSPKEVWDELKETYGKLNGSETFNLHHQINSLKQNGTHVSDYYHTLNGLWRQFDAITKLPACSCAAQKAFKTHTDLIKLMQFLTGLDDVEESHRGSSSSSSGNNKAQASVFAVKVHNNNNFKKNSDAKNPNLVCTNPNCGLTGHTIEKCYKIVGYPEHIKKKWANNGNNNNQRSFSSNNSSTNTTKVPTSTATSLTSDQIQQLINMLNSKPYSNVHANMAEPLSNDDAETLSQDDSGNSSASRGLEEDASDSDSTSLGDFPDAINREMVTTSYDDITVEQTSTSKDNFNITNVNSDQPNLRKSSRTSKLPLKLSDFIIDGKPFLGKAKKQSVMSRSSAEAEYRALASVTCEVMEKIVSGIIKPLKIELVKQLADIFTKGLSVDQHNQLLKGLIVVFSQTKDGRGIAMNSRLWKTRARSSSSSSGNNKAQASVFAVKVHNNNNFKKNSDAKNPNLVCTNPNCGLTGHTIEKCYKIVGYPEHIKKKWANNRNNNNQRSFSLNNSSTNTAEIPTSTAPSLTSDQIQQQSIC